MKPILAAAIVTTLVTAAFAIDVVPAVPPSVSSSDAPCSACREATCSTTHSSCATFETAATASSSATQCTAAADCSASCDDARTAELQSAGLEPYRIGSPDAVSIRVSLRKAAACLERDCQATECDEHESNLTFANSNLRQVVGPDGHIAIDGLGSIYVAGLTTGEAECEITKQILERHPQTRDAILAVSIDVFAKNSKHAYVVLQDGPRGDNVWQVPVSKDTTVGSALRKSAWPHPIDFASAKIWVARHCSTRESCEASLPVVWDAVQGEPTGESNHALLPGDRLFVELTDAKPQTAARSTQASPGPLTQTLADFLVGVPAALPYQIPKPVIAPQPGQPLAAMPLSLPAPPGIPSTKFYAAVPAAVPSPYAPQAVPLSSPYPATVIAPQAYVTAAAPIAPSAPQPHPLAAPDTAANASQHDGQTVEFAITVVKDVSGSFAEFPKLRDGLLMVSDSDVVLGTVRVMEKQQLVKRISAPRIMCAAGEQASMCIATAVADDDAESAASSLSVNVKAHCAGTNAGGSNMQLETSVRTTRDRHVHEVQLACLVAEGQTAIIRSHHPSQRSTDGDLEHPVYVVVTPTIVK